MITRKMSQRWCGSTYSCGILSTGITKIKNRENKRGKTLIRRFNRQQVSFICGKNPIARSRSHRPQCTNPILHVHRSNPTQPIISTYNPPRPFIGILLLLHRRITTTARIKLLLAIKMYITHLKVNINFSSPVMGCLQLAPTGCNSGRTNARSSLYVSYVILV